VIDGVFWKETGAKMEASTLARFIEAGGGT